MSGEGLVESATAAEVEAQAKINLLLRVLAREDSGYHQVETLLCRVGLADRVRVRLTSRGDSLDCSGTIPAAGLGPVERNLAWRAAVAYREASGFPGGFAIEVEKRIPVGGGLGGGSADAGAVLRALNALNPAPLPPAELLRLAGTLGADVPFLTQDVSPLALAWGRGDRMLVLPPLPERGVYLFTPNAGVSTVDAYRWIDEHPRTHPATALAPSQLDSWAGVKAVAGNDFEAVVGVHQPGVGYLLELLRTPGPPDADATENNLIQMSGSGSTIFVVIAPEEEGWTTIIGIDDADIRQVFTRTATFVEPVVLTH